MTPFIIEGDLWLRMQEGGFAWDAWELENQVPDPLNSKPIWHRLEDRVAQYFSAKPIWGERGYECKMGPGARHIGPVRITIEEIEE